MILRIFFISLLFTAALPSWALRVFFDYKVFLTPDQQPYIECITAFDGPTFATAQLPNGSFQASAQITIVISNDDQVVDFRKVAVQGPEGASGTSEDFMSLERFFLPFGTYNLEIEISDLVNQAPPEKLSQKIAIDRSSTVAAISDLQFVSAYTPTVDVNAFSKSGYDLLPLISNYYTSEMNSLLFYAELYNTDQLFGADNAFVSTVCILDMNNAELAQCKRIKREKAAAVIPVLQAVDISTLPTGQYKLRLEIRDRVNELVCAKEQLFTRNKLQAIPIEKEVISKETLDDSFVSQFTEPDSLYEIIRCHLPIAETLERNTIDNSLGNRVVHQMQSFLYVFWKKRKPEDPAGAFQAYMKEVEACQKEFGTKIKKGWETDRGRAYLYYGRPSTRIVRNHDPDYWPFEIWHYYETNQQLHDRRLLFINTTLNTDMELLHSDIPGEIQNNDWKRLARSRAQTDPGNLGRITNEQGIDPYSFDQLEDLWFNPY
jgi:GWxTD domain-containing protein